MAEFDRIERAALPFNPVVSVAGSPPATTIPASVVIRYDGTNIADDVIMASAEFISMANGAPGTCKFRIRDIEHDYSITVGKRLRLEINGVNAWTGYVSRVSRVFAFPAMDQLESRPRLLEIEGVDVNILFRKRFVFNKSNPRNLMGRTYSADNTDDDDVVADLVSDFLDLSGDNLDTSTLVENVGTVNVDQPANPIAPGYTWEQTMRSIVALSSGVFYINPDRQLVLTDVDTPNAPFALSDHPTGGEVGYRDLEILHNGSAMINDALVWGAGMGSATMVFSREEDATSIAAHGRWQHGEFNTSMFRQATVNRRADSIVQGSAQSKRGAKNDAVSVTCTIFEPGVRVADKIDFTCDTHGYTDVIPVRRMKITFINPYTPRYELNLSHEIDMPWGFFDIYMPKIPGIVIPEIRVDIPEIPGPDIDIDTCQGCSDATCTDFDDFNRTEATELGGGWTEFADNGSPTTEVDGALAVMTVPAQAAEAGTFTEREYTIPDGPWTDGDFVMYSRVNPINAAGLSGFNQTRFFFNDGTNEHRVSLDPNGPSLRHYINAVETDVADLPGSSFTTDFYIFRWQFRGGTHYINIYQDGGGDTGSHYLVFDNVVDMENADLGIGVFRSSLNFPVGVGTAEWDYIEFCDGLHAEVVDDFERTDSTGWGTSSSGTAWVTTQENNGGDVSVDGQRGVLLTPGNNSQASVSYGGAVPSDFHTTLDHDSIKKIRFEWDNATIIPSDFFYQVIWGFFRETGSQNPNIRWGSNGVTNDWRIRTTSGAADGTVIPDAFFVDGTIYEWTIEITGSNTYETAITDGIDTYSTTGAFVDGQVRLSIATDQSTEAPFVATNRAFMVHDITIPEFCDPGTTVSGGSVIDDFNRIESNQLGVASSGYTWVLFNELDIDIDVNGSQATWQTSSEDGQGYGNLVGVAELSGTFDLRMTFTIDTVPNGTASQEEVLVWTAWYDEAISNGVVYNMHISSHASFGLLEIAPFGTGQDSVVKTDWIADTTYTVRISQNADTGDCKLKIWPTDDPEPDDWDLETSVSDDLADPLPVYEIGINADVDAGWLWQVDSIVVGGDDCGQVAVPSSGRVCQSFEGDGTETRFIIPQAAQWGSMEISVNGLLQRAIFNYNTIMIDGQIRGAELGFTPEEGASIEICYIVTDTYFVWGLGPV